MKCLVFDLGFLITYKYAVTFARYKNKWIVCKHKNRNTWETSGGHIEKGETALEAAKRELFEETGATDFDITPVCDYWAGEGHFENKDVKKDYGQVFLADVKTIGKLPESEMERIDFFDQFPENLTYPEITRALLPLVCEKLSSNDRAP